MERVKDIHNSISNLLGFGVIGMLWSISDTSWWSCSDHAEQIIKFWSYSTIGLGVGLGTMILARHFNHNEKLRFILEMTVKMLLLYVLISVAMIKTEGQFYDLSLITKQYKLSELDSSSFAAAFYGYSSFFQSYSGAILVLGLSFLVFRSTSRLGILILLGTLVNNVVLNHSFESCYIFKNSIYLAAVSYLFFNDIFAFGGYLLRKPPFVKYDWSPISSDHHLYKSASVYKFILLAGLLFYNHNYVLKLKNNKGRNKNNPIAGVWNVDKIDFLTSNIPKNIKKDLEEIEKVILDKDRFGAVEVGDSLSYFEFIVNPKDNQLEFWNFYNFREFDIKGKYDQISPDTLLYTGRNNKDSIHIVFTLDK